MAISESLRSRKKKLEKKCFQTFFSENCSINKIHQVNSKSRLIKSIISYKKTHLTTRRFAVNLGKYLALIGIFLNPYHAKKKSDYCKSVM